MAEQTPASQLDTFSPPSGQTCDLEGSSPTTSLNIRKSCYFCRSRKIRCSGGHVCTACRARNSGCVYGREGSKGRPRSTKSASAPRKAQMDNEEHTLSSPIPFPLHQSAPKPSPTPVKTDFSDLPQEPIAAGDLLFGAALEYVFQHEFRKSLTPVETAGPAHSAIDSGFESLCSAGHYHTPEPRERPCTDTNFGLFPKKSPLLSLSQDLVELVSQRFGSLGCVQREECSADYVQTLLIQDDTSTMLEDDVEPESLPEYSDHYLCQMIELWILHHPLSFLVSKTLLLHSYRIKIHDSILIAVILGGACLTLGGAETVQGHSFFHWAQKHFRRRYAGFPSISTIQVLIFLGWYEQCCLNARRAFCYVYLARMALKETQRRYEETPPTNVDWLNGIDVGKVELELCQRMYWLTFALGLWAAMHLNVSFDVQAVPNKEMKVPPLDKEDSAVYNLDKRSGNLAALKQQEKAMHDLWPLSHVACTIGLVYALHPRLKETMPASPTHGWTSNIFPQLRRLIDNPKSPQIVCQSIKYSLSDGISTILAPQGHRSSNCYVLTAYRILTIHLLFPRLDPGLHTEAMTDARLDDIIYSVGAFKNHAESLCGSPSNGNPKDMEPFEPSLLVLGLDTCSRALSQLQNSLKANTTGEDGWSTSRLDELTKLAEGLHRICKYQRLRPALALPLVKRHLKSVKRDFESFGRPISAVDRLSQPVDYFDEDWLSQPMDLFQGWIPSDWEPQIAPMSGTSI